MPLDSSLVGQIKQVLLVNAGTILGAILGRSLKGTKIIKLGI